MEKAPKFSRQKFVEACGNNDMKFIKNSIENMIVKIVPLDFALDTIKAAANNGNIEIIKYLLERPNSDKFFAKHIPNIFTSACIDNHIDTVRYLIESHRSKVNTKDKSGRDNYSNISVGAYYAARAGNVEILDYILKSNFDELTPESLKDGVLFSYSCVSPDLKSVKYLLSKPELRENIDIHFEKDSPFKRLYDHRDFEAIKFFIFDLNIDKTEEIQNYINRYSNDDAKKVKELFDLREFTENLAKELNTNQNNQSNKKLKV